MRTDNLTREPLATEINDLYEYSEHHKDYAVIYAARCGAKLNVAKAQRKHGEWLDWLNQHCVIKTSQAQNYMKLAVQYPELIDPNTHPGGYLPSIKTMLSLMDASDDVKAQVEAKQAAGEIVTKKDVDTWKKKAEKASADVDKLQQKLGSVSGDLQKAQRNIADLVRDGIAEQMKSHTIKAQALTSEKDELTKKLAKKKKEYNKDVTDGVKKALKPQQDEIDQKERDLQDLEKDIVELEEAKKNLSIGYATIKRHQIHIKKINEAFHVIAMEMFDAADEGQMPHEMQKEWDTILKNSGDCERTMRKYMGFDHAAISNAG